MTTRLTSLGLLATFMSPDWFRFCWTSRSPKKSHESLSANSSWFATSQQLIAVTTSSALFPSPTESFLARNLPRNICLLPTREKNDVNAVKFYWKPRSPCGELKALKFEIVQQNIFPDKLRDEVAGETNLNCVINYKLPIKITERRKPEMIFKMLISLI